MITYIKATQEHIDLLMDIRMEMLRIVNGLSDKYVYDEDFVIQSRKYFEEGDQTTFLAMDGDTVVGCASLSYIWIMPTFSHPTGKRAHLMNVYTNQSYRRMGIARRLVELLIEEARTQGVTEISLDATDMGRPLYEALGFKASDEAMVLNL